MDLPLVVDRFLVVSNGKCLETTVHDGELIMLMMMDHRIDKSIIIEWCLMMTTGW